MLIISKFHDYYDTASAYGIDKTVVFQRTNKFIKSKGDELEKLLPYGEELKLNKDREIINVIVNKSIVGFCGQIYPLVSVEITSWRGLKEEHFFYSVDETTRFFKENNLFNINRRGGPYSGYFYHKNHSSFQNEKGIRQYFNQDNWRIFEKVFVEQKCPTFVYTRTGSNRFSEPKLEINPKLFDVKFMKVKDPQTAFQEIYMYISGVLGTPEKEIIKISDEDKQAAKGHDGEYSFRKPPGGGRWR